MKNGIKISMLGGDLRQIYVAKKLAEVYGEPFVWGIEPPLDDRCCLKLCDSMEEALCGAAAVVLPLPSTSDGKRLNCPRLREGESPLLGRIFELVPSGCRIIGGKMPESFKLQAVEKGFEIFDYFDSESFQIKNAYITAEAALSIAMNGLGRSLRGARVCVTGFGRIAKHIVALLLPFGASVTVAARKESDLAFAESLGCEVLRIREDKGWLLPLRNGYDVIYNTVPCWLFERDFLASVSKKTFIIDLASPPGGVDIRAARELSANVSWATSLPGKYAPESAGEIIARCVSGYLEEAGI